MNQEETRTTGTDRAVRLDGIVYTETIVHSPPEQYAADAPYELAIIDISAGDGESGERRTVRVTVRILGHEPQERAQIGDRVVFVEERNGVSYYRKETMTPAEIATETVRPLV